MDDFEKYRKCSGQVLEREIKGEKFLFKPLKGKDLWKLMKLDYNMRAEKPEDIVNKITDENLDLTKTLAFTMLKDANPDVPDEMLNNLIDYNLFEMLGIIREINYGTIEKKDVELKERINELGEKNAVPEDKGSETKA